MGCRKNSATRFYLMGNLKFQVQWNRSCDTMKYIGEHEIAKGRQDDRMNSQDWERFGEDIRRTIQDAVEYGNYDRLNQTITNTVNQATDWVSRNVNNVKNVNTGNQTQYNYQQNNYQQNSYQQAAYRTQVVSGKNRELFGVKNSSKVMAILFIIFGYTIGGFMALLTLLGILGTVFTGEFIAAIVYAVIMLPMTAGFLFVAYKGSTLLTRINRFNKYLKEIGTAEFCNISDLAQQVQKSEKFVIKDLEKMIDKGWFKQGHLDRQKTCLIVTNQMYEQYKQLEQQKDLQLKEEEQRMRKQTEGRQALSPEVQKVIEQGDAYVRKIRECNDAIPGEEISAKIYNLEMVVDKIFDRVEQNPSLVSDIRKLMEYYLPTTVKLLEAYAEMDAQPVGGDNIQTAKKEIEATLDTLNTAFEKLLDSLFQHAAWDVSSDISVLNTMLAQEGLKGDGLKK